MNPYLGKIAYSNYFKSFICCVHFQDDLHWRFRKCSPDGKPNGFVLNAQSPASVFEWRDISATKEIRH